MNVKQGDLAIVIKSLNGKAVGSIVRVASFFNHCPQNGPEWNVEVARKSTVKCRGTGRLIVLQPGGTAQCPDAWLRPISGLPDADEVDTSEPTVTEAA